MHRQFANSILICHVIILPDSVDKPGLYWSRMDLASTPRQKGRQIGLGDANCPADAGGKQLAGLDEPANGFGADSEMLGDVRDGQQPGQAAGRSGHRGSAAGLRAAAVAVAKHEPAQTRSTRSCHSAALGGGQGGQRRRLFRGRGSSCAQVAVTTTGTYPRRQNCPTALSE